MYKYIKRFSSVMSMVNCRVKIYSVALTKTLNVYSTDEKKSISSLLMIPGVVLSMTDIPHFGITRHLMADTTQVIY